MTALIWHKNFGYCLLGKTAAPSIKPKLWKSLAALFVEIFSKKILWGGFRPIWVTQWQEFEIFPQKWRFQIFQVALLSRWLQWFLNNDDMVLCVCLPEITTNSKTICAVTFRRPSCISAFTSSKAKTTCCFVCSSFTLIIRKIHYRK